MAIGRRIPGQPGTAPTIDPPAHEEPPAPRPSTPPPAAGARDRTSPRRIPAELQVAVEAARKYRNDLMQRPHVLDVRGGYLFVDGRITNRPAIVVIVDQKVDGLGPAGRLPESLDGIPIDVAVADPYERLAVARERGETTIVPPTAPRLLIDELQRPEEGVAEAVPVITYEPPVGADLDAVTGPMTVTCHVSPDAGWRVLRPFLEGTSERICLGMYDFTAPHIYQTARTILKNDGVEWQQTLGPKESLPGEDDVDSTKADDLTERQVVQGLRRVAGRRFDSAFAHVGAGQTFASAYHIKVAVRDRKAFWLSSGNWQSSNQPDIDFLDSGADTTVIPRYNREWHMVVESAELARKFERYLEHDFDTASAPAPEAAPAPMPDLLVPVEAFLAEETARRDIEVFAPQTFKFPRDEPLTIQPILTPDNYIQIVTKLLRERPSRSLYFQNQSLNPILQPTREFDALMQLLVDYSNDDALDVRLIFRNIGPMRKKLESLQAAGFNMKRIRMQAGCHTKGIVVDSRVVLVGSHNFTNQGVQVNRDASLLIRHAGIAKYYERIFLHDWEQLARETIREEAMPIPVGTSGVEAANLTEHARVPWSFLAED